MMTNFLPWIVFNVFVVLMLVLDLCVFHRKSHEIKIKEALWLSLFWTVLALAFNVGIYFWHGKQEALEFFTGYIIERSLSIDNLFVFLVVFNYFKVPNIHHHKILYWGILGALIMRAIFIFSGVALIERFHWIMYVFGAFLIFTGIKMIWAKDKEIEPEKNIILKLTRKFLPVTHEYDGAKFFTRKNHKLLATPLFIVLLVIETTDVVFALDSIPAILAVTTNTFIVYSSNVFAILGLRALYFAMAGMVKYFHYLNYGLAAILSFIGIKMIITDFYKIPTSVALGAVGIILVMSVVASIIWPERARESL